MRFDTGYFLRELVAAQRLRAVIADGELGHILRVRGRFAHAASLSGAFDHFAWMREPRLAGFGALGDLGIHLLDLFGWMLNEPPELLDAQLGTVTPGVSIDEYGEVAFRCGKRTIGSIAASWVEHHPRGGSLEVLVCGTAGTARLIDGALSVSGPDIDMVLREPGPDAAAAIERFLDGGSERSVDVRTAAAHCVALERVYAAARS